MLANNKPVVIAITVVNINRRTVLPPIRATFLRSERDAAPTSREAKTRGTAIILRRRTKISPTGLMRAPRVFDFVISRTSVKTFT